MEKKEAQKVRERPAQERSCSFEEVVLGYSEDEALKEASRCLQCKTP
ncbi:MAG: dihydropyrimidine dehydrogenase, partial [Candidatus Omnitrophica bacterium]|nr:dihydropyrimidine dehydrogenase [Candidatus Omnitrophota bacterium]